MKRLFYLFFFLLPSILHARYRPIDIMKEIKNAKHVGEIIFNGYDSIHVSQYSNTYQRILTDSISGKKYYDTTYSDSVWNINAINFKSIRNINPSIKKAGIHKTHSWNFYTPRPDSLPLQYYSHGFWPRKGDTCIVVIDSLNKVSLFGLLIKGEYVFWDPYPNSGRISVIAFDPPFSPYPNSPTSKFYKRISKMVSDRFGRKSASVFHCSIDKKRFWKEIINNSP